MVSVLERTHDPSNVYNELHSLTIVLRNWKGKAELSSSSKLMSNFLESFLFNWLACPELRDLLRLTKLPRRDF